MIVVIHPTANANVRALTEGLLKNALLQRFYTCVALFRNSQVYPLTKFGMLKEFRKRIFTDALKPYTESRPYKEIMRLGAQKLGNNNLVRHETGRYSIDHVYRDLDLYVSGKLQKASAVYAYEDGAYQSFQVAKSHGINCLYDLPIGYWRAMRQLLEEEKYKNPEWSVTHTGFKDSEEKLLRKDSELRLADHIFVASTFTAETLKNFPGKLAPVHIVPYGFPPVSEKKNYIPLVNRRLKVLFVGGLSQRKGISYLFEAIDQIEDKVELTVVGQKTTQNCQILNENLSKHDWIPRLPHSEILELMQSHDILVFPSLFEGFGLVVTEAMSQGTPVITTERTCGPDVITNGENGWIIKAGSTEALTTCLEEILANPGCLKEIGEAAMETAKNRPWEVYGLETAEIIAEVLEKDKILF